MFKYSLEPCGELGTISESFGAGGCQEEKLCMLGEPAVLDRHYGEINCDHMGTLEQPELFEDKMDHFGRECLSPVGVRLEA